MSDPTPHDDGRPPAAVSGVRLTNPARRLFPRSSMSKLELARYYAAVGRAMLPLVGERPLTLVRCPRAPGEAACFYQRHPERGMHPAVGTARFALPDRAAPDEWLYVDSVEGLVALAQLGTVEIHAWPCRVSDPGRPDRLILDLDPGPGATWSHVVSVASRLRAMLDALGLSAFALWTGSKGLHVIVPLLPAWGFDRVRALARAVAARIAASDPRVATARPARAERAGRVFIDYLRNAEGASSIAPYSTRYRPGPPVAVPLAWHELRPSERDVRSYTPELVLERIATGPDPWAELEAASASRRLLERAETSLR